MGADIIKKAAVHVHDTHKHVFANRGVFVKAPPEFFRYYGSDFTNLTPKEQRLILQPDTRVATFPDWAGLQPVTVEVPVPEPTVVASTVEVPPVVAEPVAVATATEPKEVLPRKKKAGTSRRVVIR